MDNLHRPQFMRRTGLVIILLMLCLSTGLIGCGGGSSSSSSTPVITAPTITSQPAAQTASVGGSFSLSVVASGSSLSYQWYKDSVAISGATSSVYTIASAATTDTGNYSVIVTNSAGSVTSNSVAVTVSATTGTGTVTVQ